MSEHFDAGWLSLREPADHAARSTALADALAAWARQVRATPQTPLRVFDLGAGRGSGLRWLAPLLPEPQHWTLVDHDAELLEAACWGAGGEYVRERRVEDFAAGPPPLPDPPPGEPLVVTGSALLDLVSADWLDRLVAACAERGAAVLFALSYDGRIEASPADPGDAALRAAVNRHQLTDKGFGPALGPRAGEYLARRLEDHGYAVEMADAVWDLDASRAGLARALMDGWVAAASAIEPGRAAAFREWGERRRAHIDRGEGRLRVGHRDVLGLPQKFSVEVNRPTRRSVAS